MANAARGEVELTLGSKVFVMRPGYGAQQLIESDLDGERMISITRRITNAEFGMTDAYVIIKRGIADAGTEIDDDELGDLVAAAGLDHLVSPIMQFLQFAIRGWGEEKNGAAPPKKRTKEASET